MSTDDDTEAGRAAVMRDALVLVLDSRFAPDSEELAQRIEHLTDEGVLTTVLRQVALVEEADELLALLPPVPEE